MIGAIYTRLMVATMSLSHDGRNKFKKEREKQRAFTEEQEKTISSSEGQNETIRDLKKI